VEGGDDRRLVGEAGGPGVTPAGDSPDTAADPIAAFQRRCDAIEEAYEFFLAYASQGLPTETGGSQIRDFLGKLERALDGLGPFFAEHLAARQLDADPFRAFIEVIDRDARSALAAVRMVLAQPSINSQIVDSLNASIHVRAMLTDIFLIDEVLKQR